MRRVCAILGQAVDAVSRPESMSATSQTALLERRLAVSDVDKTAQLKWLRLRELLPKRSTVVVTPDSSPSTAVRSANRPAAAANRHPEAVDPVGVRPSKLSRVRRAASGGGRDGDPAARTLKNYRRPAPPKAQTSFDSYVTAPSQDGQDHIVFDDDDDDEGDQFPLSSPHIRRSAARTPDKRDAPTAFPIASNELPLLDLRLSSSVPNISPSADGDFEFDPFEYELETGDSEDNLDTEKVTVPVTICLVIIGGYIFAGAVLFTLWEDWDYLTGSYFCFITLSTIGFGDIVPGTDMDKWASSEKLVLCALWLAFGLSLLAMCFNLMQEEVKEKCKWIGQKLGLLKDAQDAG